MRTPAFALALSLALFAAGARASDRGIGPAEDAGIGPAEDAGIAAEPAPPPVETDLSAIPAGRRPTLKLTVAPKSATVGEAVVWRAEVRHRVTDSVHLSSAADFGDFEVQDKKIESGKADGEWAVTSMEVRLVAFETGAHEIPAQAIAIVAEGGAVGTLATGAATVDVKSLIANEPEPKLKEDKGPGEKVLVEDYTLLYVLAAVGGGIAIVLLTLLARWLWSKRRPKPAPPPPPPRPAEEIALEKLEALRASDHLADGRHKLFHILLSEAFREYLGNRYGFDSLERSTEELLGELRARRLDLTLYRRMLDFLSETDLVKFAKYVPDVAESSRLLDGAFALVRDTTPKAEPAEQGGPHA